EGREGAARRGRVLDHVVDDRGRTAGRRGQPAQLDPTRAGGAADRPGSAGGAVVVGDGDRAVRGVSGVVLVEGRETGQLRGAVGTRVAAEPEVLRGRRPAVLHVALGPSLDTAATGAGRAAVA